MTSIVLQDFTSEWNGEQGDACWSDAPGNQELQPGAHPLPVGLVLLAEDPVERPFLERDEL